MLRALMLLLIALPFGAARGHELTMAEMEVRETARGEFIWQWTASGSRAAQSELTPRWPDGCSADHATVRCGAAGLSGRFGIDGVGRGYSAAIVRIRWADGQARVYTLTGGHPEVQLYGAADDPRGIGEIASAYLVLGVEHILTGYDHLAFVLGLLFLVGFQRRLVVTITAFTLAHSLTLALAALQILTLRPPPVEATIALSIMLVAGEALHTRATLARRWPALVAFLFGLVHGLGFAGALQQVGLPQNHLAVALLTFNLGVEAGQLLVVALAYALWHLSARWPLAARARTPALYAIGGIAGYWSIGRIVALLA